MASGGLWCGRTGQFLYNNEYLMRLSHIIEWATRRVNPELNHHRIECRFMEPHIIKDGDPSLLCTVIIDNGDGYFTIPVSDQFQAMGFLQ